MFRKPVLKGQICPIAELAGKKQCLGSICAWHKPNTETKCILTEIAAIFPMVCEMKKNIDYISDSITRAEKECKRGVEITAEQLPLREHIEKPVLAEAEKEARRR
jgi:hypothetical protein